MQRALLKSANTKNPQLGPNIAKSIAPKREENGEIDWLQAPLQVHNAIHSHGEPLESPTRNLMESKLNFSFDKVRVHSDPEAAKSAQAVGALAYTHGNDVVFGFGQYDPLTERGQDLITHELTHVIEQNTSYSRIQRATPNQIATQPSPTVVETYELTLDGKAVTLSKEEYTAQKAKAIRSLKVDFELLEDEAKFNRQQHQEFLDKTHNWAGVISDILADTVPPSTGIWTWPAPAIANGRKALQEENFVGAGKQLKLAQESLRDAKREWNTYIDATTGGAEKAVTVLEFTRDISFSIAIGTAAVVAAPVVAGVLAGGGAVGAGTVLGTGAIVTAGGGATGAVLRGGTSVAGQALAGESVSGAQVWKETKEGFKKGAVDAGSAVVGLGVGKAIGAGAKGASLATKIAKGTVVGSSSGASGGALEATLEGKSPAEIAKATGKGALSGGLGGGIGTAASHGSGGKLTKLALETLGEAGSGAASAIVSGGSAEDVKKAVISSVIAGRASSLATHPTAPTAKAKLKPTTEQPAMPERPIAPAKQPTEPKISYGEVELPPGEGSLELDTSGNREGWNKHLEEFQVADAAKISEPTKKPTFGEPSNLKGGTEHHTGMGFHEYSAAEVAIGLRIDWDPQAGRPRKVTYNFTSEAAKVSSQATDRSFHQEPRLKGESAQSRERAYTNSGMERGHLAQREAGKVDADIDAALGLSKSTAPEVERSLDVLTNVAPMTPTLNKGPAWRAAETRTAQYALKEGYVTVEIEPIYDAKPKRLSDGTPIPSSFRRAIKSGLDGRVLEDLTFPNI